MAPRRSALVLAILLFFAIPRCPPRAHLRYPSLIGSVFVIVARERTVRWSLVLGGSSFAVFTMFWTSLTFLLSAPPFSFPVTVIGLFGLVGLAGAAAAQRVGRLNDRGLGLPTIGVAWALVLLAFVVAGVGQRSVVVIVVAILLLDVAIQGHNITVQSRMFQLDPQARSRLNTAFVTNNFLWGAVGSGLASFLCEHGGWTAVMVAAAVLSRVRVHGVGGRCPLRRGRAAAAERRPLRSSSRVRSERRGGRRSWRGRPGSGPTVRGELEAVPGEARADHDRADPVEHEVGGVGRRVGAADLGRPVGVDAGQPLARRSAAALGAGRVRTRRCGASGSTTGAGAVPAGLDAHAGRQHAVDVAVPVVV